MPILFRTRFCEKLFSGEEKDFRKTSAICISPQKLAKRKRGLGKMNFCQSCGGRRRTGNSKTENIEYRCNVVVALAPPARARATGHFVLPHESIHDKNNSPYRFCP